MPIGEQITRLRKRKGLSQAALGKAIGTSGDIVGRYERDDVTPSIEVVVKIADALGVSLDYLVGKTALELDTQMTYRLELLQHIAKDQRERILYVFDTLLKDAQQASLHQKLAG